MARRLEEQGNLTGALENYRQAQALAPAESSLAEDLRLIVSNLETGQEVQSIPTLPPPVEEETEDDTTASDLQLPVEETETTDAAAPSVIEKVSLDDLFDDGLAAYRQEKWAEAKELLAEVVRRQPDYERDGQRASDLLESATSTSRLPEEKPGAVTSSPARAAEETGLDVLFNDGLAAYRREEWAKAKELLAEVVRQQPDYEWDGQKANVLLAEAQKRLVSPHRRVPVWGWVLAGLAVLALLVVTIVPKEAYVPTPTLTPTSTAIPTGTPTPQPTLPSPVSTALSSVDVLYHDDFERFSSVYWERYTSSSNINTSDGLVEITGNSSWGGVGYKRTVKGDEGVLVLFKYDPGAEFELFLDVGAWQDSAYRRWGIYTGIEFNMNIWKGSYDALSGIPLRGNLTLRPNTWYYLLLAVDQDAAFVARVWEKEDPTRQVEYQRQFDDDWRGKSWRFAIGANKGKAYVDAFTVVSFDDIK